MLICHALDFIAITIFVIATQKIGGYMGICYYYDYYELL